MNSIQAEPPRTAFMIVAHNNPAHLARLVDRLAAPWSAVIVAVDAKVDQQPFAAALAGRRATLLPNNLRVDIQWGGIGLTTAACRMMREAIDRWSPERFCILSGVDYPAKPLDEIGRALRAEVEWVRVDRRLDGAGTSLHDDFVRFPHFNDIRLLNPRSSPIPKLQRAATRSLRVLRRAPVGGLDLFHGSGWWTITREAADWILGFLARRPDVWEWFRHVNCPDEIVVQSLLKTSPCAPRIKQDLTARAFRAEDQNLHGCHFVDWELGTSSSPKILDVSDLAAIRCSPALFARKIDPVRSASLLDALDEVSVVALEAP